MNDIEFENVIAQMLSDNAASIEGLGFHKKFKKLAKKIVKKVKKVAIPAAKIGIGFATGGPVGAGAMAAKLAVDESGRKKMKKAAKKAKKRSLAENQAAITAELMAQEGVNFTSPQSRMALQQYVGARQSSPLDAMKYVIPAVGGVAVLMLLINR